MTARAEPGTFCRVELAARDIARAESFYSGLFGWDLHQHQLPHGRYTLIQRDGIDLGAFYGLPPGASERPQWLAYVSVEHIDRAARRVGELGGRVVTGPLEAGPTGLMAVVEDPTGARLGLWQPHQPPAREEVEDRPGSPCWMELLTSDLDLAARFYGGLFDWRPELQGPEDAHTTTFFLGGRRIAGVAPLGASSDWVTPHWLLYFAVDDCAASSRRAEELGATLLIAPTEVREVGCHAALADPSGAAFGLLRAG